MNSISKQHQNNPFAGRTKNEIRHAYMCAEIFKTTVEDILKPFTFSESYYVPKERILEDSDFERKRSLKS